MIKARMKGKSEFEYVQKEGHVMTPHAQFMQQCSSTLNHSGNAYFFEVGNLQWWSTGTDSAVNTKRVLRPKRPWKRWNVYVKSEQA